MGKMGRLSNHKRGRVCYNVLCESLISWSGHDPSRAGLPTLQLIRGQTHQTRGE